MNYFNKNDPSFLRGSMDSVGDDQPYMRRRQDLDNLSLTLAPNELKRFLNNTSINFNDDTTLAPGSSMELFRISEASEIYFKDTSDQLYSGFLNAFKCHASETEVFDVISELVLVCTEQLEHVFKQIQSGGPKESTKIEWLIEERNVWRLIHCLYKDRLIVQNEQMDADDIPLTHSEREVVERLYATNSNLREYQLIVDWLELCATERDDIQIGQFTDRTVGWENTLAHLKSKGATVFGSNRELVKSIDPDAPTRERKPLHDLDMEDEKRLAKQLFALIRQGNIDEAQGLCEHCGQPWRAAILEGWRLHHDPNYDSITVDEKLPIEGNPRRDIWKKGAYMFAGSRHTDPYFRAVAGCLCGHLKSLLAVVNNCWDDMLWAYLKVQIDIRVESEIRTTCTKNYVAMPDEYWNSKMSLEQIFNELATSDNINVKNKSENLMNFIQKFIMLDDISGMMRQIDSLLNEGDLLPQSLRFLTHVVLFMRQIDRNVATDIGDRVIKAYVSCLIELGDPSLVAFYTAVLPNDMQILMYSKFLQSISNTEDRTNSLQEALSAGLDIDAITSHAVETIRTIEDKNEIQGLAGTITDSDDFKISALEWLTFYTKHRGELLWQTNALIRNFLAQNKIESVRKIFEMVPQDSIVQIIGYYGSKDNLPAREECSIKEYLCYQTYLAAIDGFNDWHRLYNNKPKEPTLANAEQNFTDRVALEHQEQMYHADMERWETNLEEQVMISRDLMFNVLMFPDSGWLIDPEYAKSIDDELKDAWHNRLVQMENLRKLCIPEIIMLLHTVLHSANQFNECLKLADEIASERRQLYKVFPQYKLNELLSKLVESSLAALNAKQDPWGYSNN